MTAPTETGRVLGVEEIKRLRFAAFSLRAAVPHDEAEIGEWFRPGFLREVASQIDGALAALASLSPQRDELRAPAMKRALATVDRLLQVELQSRDANATDGDDAAEYQQLSEARETLRSLRPSPDRETDATQPE